MYRFKMNQAQQLQAQQLMLEMQRRQQLMAGQMPVAAFPQLNYTQPQPVSARAQRAIEKIRQSTKVKKRQFIALRIRNNSAEAQNVVIFDALGTYQQQNGILISDDVEISGLSKFYNTLQRRFLGGNTLFFDQINLQVNVNSQFDRPINIFVDDIATNNARLEDTIYPSEGLNSMQQQENRVEIAHNFKVGPETALQYVQEPESEVLMRLFIDEQATFA